MAWKPQQDAMSDKEKTFPFSIHQECPEEGDSHTVVHCACKVYKHGTTSHGSFFKTMFIKEIFGQKSPDDFDEETITTIHKFFENSLNVSETSRQLFIHRNTLVYRLDKLQKSTGLDLRVFEDAITFKIMLICRLILAILCLQL